MIQSADAIPAALKWVEIFEKRRAEQLSPTLQQKLEPTTAKVITGEVYN